MKVKCFHTPCHTQGHIIYYLQAGDGEGAENEMEAYMDDNGYKIIKNVNRCAFTGDTIFIGGCGKFFEGNAE